MKSLPLCMAWCHPFPTYMNNISLLTNEVLSRKIKASLFLIGSFAHKYSFSVYVVGEFARAVLQGKESRYINLVVEDSAVDYARKLVAIFPGKLHCCDRFGTAKLVNKGGVTIDMVTSKEEFSPFTSDSEGKNTSLRKSLYARDFTINSLACSLNHEDYGRFYDFFGGYQDLQQKKIRVFNKLSFVEDPLRMLKAILLEQKLNFNLEDETLSLLQDAHNKHQLTKVSKEKLYGETKKIFLYHYPSKVLKRLEHLGLFGFIFPRVIFDGRMVSDIERLEQVLLNEYWGERRNRLYLFVTFLVLIMQKLTIHDRNYLIYLMRLQKFESQKLIIILDSLPRIIARITASQISYAKLYSLLEGLPIEGFPLVQALCSSDIASQRIFRYLEHFEDIKHKKERPL